MSFLKSVSLFHSLNEEQFLEICRRLVVVTFQPGTVIITQGDLGDEFFLIQSGKVSTAAGTVGVSELTSIIVRMKILGALDVLAPPGCVYACGVRWQRNEAWIVKLCVGLVGRTGSWLPPSGHCAQAPGEAPSPQWLKHGSRRWRWCVTVALVTCGLGGACVVSCCFT